MQLKHDRIVQIEEFIPETTYLSQDGEKITAQSVSVTVTEFLPHGNLLEIIRDGRGDYLDEDILRYYARQLIETIFYVHSCGFVHKDLKLENLLLDHEFNIKIANFGLSDCIEGSNASGFEKNHFDRTTRKTMTNMAPEIIMNAPYSGQAADVFAYAVIMFTMRAGNLPFGQAS